MSRGDPRLQYTHAYMQIYAQAYTNAYTHVHTDVFLKGGGGALWSFDGVYVPHLSRLVYVHRRWAAETRSQADRSTRMRIGIGRVRSPPSLGDPRTASSHCATHRTAARAPLVSLLQGVASAR